MTGVSGSGKIDASSIDTLLPRRSRSELYGARPRRVGPRRIEGLEHIDKVIDIDQAPIGRTPRSNPATYTGVFDAHPRALRAGCPRRARAATSPVASRST